MNENPIDLLQIKIEKAKKELPEETLRSIEAVDWKKTILDMRQKKGYSFEQLENLETETELLLCGLLNPADYPKELETRMGLQKPQVNELINELNESIFKKIREEFIKITEKKETREETPKPLYKPQLPNLQTKKKEAEEVKEPPKPPIFAQKLSGPVNAPVKTTEHTLENLSKEKVLPETPKTEPKDEKPKIDPYREIPE